MKNLHTYADITKVYLFCVVLVNSIIPNTDILIPCDVCQNLCKYLQNETILFIQLLSKLLKEYSSIQLWDFNGTSLI